MQSGWISDRWGVKLAFFIPKDLIISKNHFLTDSNDTLQIGVQTRGPTSPVKAHQHPNYSRMIKDTWEVLYFVEGTARCTIFDCENEIIDILICAEGDFLIFLSGGHAIEFIDEVKLIEFKQGPFSLSHDKIYLNLDTQN